MNRTQVAGGTGMFFGAMGSLISLILLVVLWKFAFGINRSVDQGVERVGAVLSRLEEGAGSFQGRIEACRESVDELEGRIETGLSGFAERTGLPPGTLETLRTEARFLAGRLEEWGELAALTRELFLLVEETLSSTLAYFGMEPEEREPLLAALENGQQQISETAATFEDLLTQLEGVREPIDRERYDADFKPLFDRIDAKLAEVVALSDTFSEGIEGLRKRVTEIGARIRFHVRLIAGALSLLILWMGAGQWCLFRSGWRAIRSLPATSPPSR